MLNRGERRLPVNIDEIRNHNRELAEGLLNSPFEYLPALDRALKELALTQRDRQRHTITEETVEIPYESLMWSCLLIYRTGVLCRIDGKLWRICG